MPTPTTQSIPYAVGSRTPGSRTPDKPDRYANGSEGDKPAPFLSQPPKPQRAVQHPASLNTLAPIVPAPPQITKPPFENRRLDAAPQRRLPADEKVSRGGASIPNILESSRSAPFESVKPIPPASNIAPAPAVQPSLPDVLVDPFKDDARVLRKPSDLNGVLLTSDRRVLTSGLLLRSPTPLTEAADDLNGRVPARLTANQRLDPNNSRKAVDEESDSEEVKSDVVPSAFYKQVPVQSKVRRQNSLPKTATLDEAPSVPRMAVPTRR